MNVLLVQIRESLIVEKEEFESFIKHSGLKKEELTSVNIFHQTDFNPTLIDQYDGIFIGGASEANVLKLVEFPFIIPLIELIKRAALISKPTFASCFGYQAATIAFGGDIIHSDISYEMGTVNIKLTDLAKSDPLLKYLPQVFPAVSVHKQKAVNIPPDCELLGYSAECCHIFKVINKPFWSFQFHPEVDRETLVNRLKIYQDNYADDRAYNEVISKAQETEVSNSIVKLFVEKILKSRESYNQL